MAASTATAVHAYQRDESEKGQSAGLSGHTSAEQFDAVMRSGHTYGSYLCLLSSFDEATCPKHDIEKAGIAFVQIPLEAPTDLTVANASHIAGALALMKKPVWIQCATANRASAAWLIYLAKEHKWSVDEAFAHAKAHGYKCIDKELLRNWIIASINPVTPADASGAQGSDIIFRQLFDYATWTYTYILGCPLTGEALIIDPVLEKADRDVNLAHELGLTLKYSLNTHVHADHVSGSKSLKARVRGLQSVIAEAGKSVSDIYIHEGDKLTFGSRHVTALSTPGHTDGCTSYVLDDASMVFTGDSLLIRGCGRTDFQQGSPKLLYNSVYTKLFTLPESCVVYPGHDYNGHLRSTIGEEKRFNPRLNKSEEEFDVIMKTLNLPRPKLIDVAVPANMKDGEPIPAETAPVPAVVAAAPTATKAT